MVSTSFPSWGAARSASAADVPLVPMSLSVARREEYAVEVNEQEELVTCWIAFGLRLKWGR